MRGGAGLGHPRRPVGGLVCVKLGGRARGGRGGQVDEVRRVRQGGAHLHPPPAHRRAEASAAERRRRVPPPFRQRLQFGSPRSTRLREVQGPPRSTRFREDQHCSARSESGSVACRRGPRGPPNHPPTAWSRSGSIQVVGKGMKHYHSYFKK